MAIGIENKTNRNKIKKRFTTTAISNSAGLG